jgi:hypothetical protein
MRVFARFLVRILFWRFGIFWFEKFQGQNNSGNISIFHSNGNLSIIATGENVIW